LVSRSRKFLILKEEAARLPGGKLLFAGGRKSSFSGRKAVHSRRVNEVA